MLKWSLNEYLSHYLWWSKKKEFFLLCFVVLILAYLFFRGDKCFSWSGRKLIHYIKSIQSCNGHNTLCNLFSCFRHCFKAWDLRDSILIIISTLISVSREMGYHLIKVLTDSHSTNLLCTLCAKVWFECHCILLGIRSKLFQGK